MLFNYRYHGSSRVTGNARSTEMSFAPDTLRDPTYFVGGLNRHIPFREAVCTLHSVVVSDLRFKPKQREAYQAWLKENEPLLLSEFMSHGEELKSKIASLRKELSDLKSKKSNIMTPFYKARHRYFDYIYKQDYDAWIVLDPVITVHPDEIFFEAFSLDESSYGRLSCSLEVFKNIDRFACGTTNIDYSHALYQEFMKIRDYKETQFKIDPGGFEVATGNGEAFIENKIDLPESWVRGFLQVSAAMNLPMRTIRLHPMDIHNFCFILRRHREKTGPRSMRFILKPDQPVKVRFDPWDIEIVCPRSVYAGRDTAEIRIWGRRRLHILERLIPFTRQFELHLLGTGLPSFFVAHMEDMTFTLGLSGWTANDWSRLGNFDLMAPRGDVDDISKAKVLKALRKSWFASADELAGQTGLARGTVLSTLSLYTQAGRVIYDLHKKVFRLRELSREPLPITKLRYTSEREKNAHRLVSANLVTIKNVGTSSQTFKAEKKLFLSGQVMDDGKCYDAEITIDEDQRLIRANCTCFFYRRNNLLKGPCEHMLALRIAHNRSRSYKR